ncbi:SAC3 [Candida pseudojiufengensis]|uniref:SAC3 n=1 Tax=Candida pseudojiufengensis TaxID=497109 RepID=UPI002225514E|nr:SAC3 [Candida pseudojiufengensis]KAI5960196.1 SAC3 [Candida pseudojiufengensis]
MTSPFGGFFTQKNGNTISNNIQPSFTFNNNTAFTNNQPTFSNGVLPSGNLNQPKPSENKNFSPAKRGPFKNQSKRFGKSIEPIDHEMKSSSSTPTPPNSNNSNGNQSQETQTQIFNPKDVEMTGPLFSSPSAFGFQKQNKTIQPRPIPKYFLTQPKYLVTQSFVQNEWDKQNQIKMEDMESKYQGKDYQGLYEELQKLREVERKEMENLGLVDAENTAKNLNEAIAFQGSCLDMCPVFERVRRQLENNVKNLEKDPQTNRISKERAVKAFSRPAAGQPPPLPSEVRPPHVLKQTLDYLVDSIVDKLPEAHSFIWDRTRSIRQDFTYQNSFGPEAVDCNERIVRIHLLSLHIMAGSDIEYSQQQELEQFNKALQTLMEIYQDVRDNGGIAPNEAEFRAYYLLSHFRDPDLERQIQNLSTDIFNDSKVQLALKLRNIISQNNIQERSVNNLIGALDLYVEFFKIVYSEETPLLMACLLETQFSEIRFYALKAISRAFHTKGKLYSIQNLQNVLGFDSDEKLIRFLNYYEIDIIQSNGEMLVDLFNKNKLQSQYKLNSFTEKPRPSPTYSSQLDSKIKGKSLKQFIDSGVPNNGFNLKTDQTILASNTKLIDIPRVQPTISTTKPNAFFNNIDSKSSEIKIPNFQPPQLNHKPQQTAPVFKQDIKPFEPQPQIQQQQSSLFSFPKMQQNLLNGSSTSAVSNKPPATQSPFSFGSSNTSFTATQEKASDKKSILPQTKPKIDFSFNKPTSNESSNFLAPKKVTFDSTPEIRTIPSRNEILRSEASSDFQIQQEVDAVPKQRTLKDNMKFSSAVRDIVNDLFNDVIDIELRQYLPQLLHDHNLKVKRRNVIKSLTMDLFSAFIAEISYEFMIEVKAIYRYDMLVKKKSIRKLTKKARECKENYEIKKIKRNELNSVSFSQQSLKRMSSRDEANESFKRKKQRGITQDLNIAKKQKEIQKFWEPLDLQNFIDICASKLELKIEELNLNLKWLLVVENWETDYSRWLKSKFNIKANMNLMVYENHIGNSKIDLNITSLPPNDKLNKQFFSNCSFVLLECGLCSKTNSTDISQKLSTDAKILRKILSMIEKYSLYETHIMILFWDVNQSGLSNSEITKALHLDQYRSIKSLKNLILCDMTVSQDDLNFVLTEAVNKISSDFDGSLSDRGKRHQLKIMKRKKLEEQNNLRIKKQEETNSSNKVSQLENKMMNQAKVLKKYSYLNSEYNKPISPSRPIINSSHMNSNSLANKSLAKIIATRKASRSNFTLAGSTNSTFFNSTASSSVISNGSLFNGLGKGVIEESTPINSPKRTLSNVSISNSSFSSDLRSQDSPKLSNEDKLKKLRNLAAGVKTKYLRSNLSDKN